MQKIEIDQEVLYISNVNEFDEEYSENGIRDLFSFKSDSLKKALHPVVLIGKTIKKGVWELSPDEIELSLELKLGINNNEPVFAIVNSEAEAHLSVKFVWKKEEQ